MKKRDVAEIRRRLLAHYDRGKRDLPWRGESDPYRIWVSEVMLQQTRVETVVPYFERWVERFPSLAALAQAEEEEVLKAWEGLGYYSRARRLHGAARVVRERYGGELPDRAEALRALPGVGEYTAGAVASIAFGEPVPAVDGNVRRVLSRLRDLQDPSATETQRIAASLVDPERPGDFNQALMELGATVCMPRSPECTSCPLSEHCRALAAGTVDERPLKKEKKRVPEVGVATVVAVSIPGAGGRRPKTRLPAGSSRGPSGGGARFLFRRRPDSGLLAGMWEFPGVEGEEVGALSEELGLISIGDPTVLPTVTHVFSHLKARYEPVLFRVAETVEVPSGRWVTSKGMGELPLPVAQQRIARSALETLGMD